MNNDRYEQFNHAGELPAARSREGMVVAIFSFLLAFIALAVGAVELNRADSSKSSSTASSSGVSLESISGAYQPSCSLAITDLVAENCFFDLVAQRFAIGSVYFGSVFGVDPSSASFTGLAASSGGSGTPSISVWIGGE